MSQKIATLASSIPRISTKDHRSLAASLTEFLGLIQENPDEIDQLIQNEQLIEYLANVLLAENEHNAILAVLIFVEFTKDITYEQSIELTNCNFLRHLLNAISSNEFDASVGAFKKGLQIVQLILIVLTNCCSAPLLWM